jgi:formate/nitrite transporter FocA (FNT family)
MDYVRPADVAKAMVETGSRKLTLSISDLLVRGMLSGAILGVATSLAFNASFPTGQPLVGGRDRQGGPCNLQKATAPRRL